MVERPERSFSSIVLAILPKQDLVVLVYETTKPLPIFWKLPGGRVDYSADGNDPKKTAIRELEGETGLIASVDELILLCKENKGTHDRYLFVAIINVTDPELDSMLKETGDEGELVGQFGCLEITHMPEFFPDHLELLNRPDVRKKLQVALEKFQNQ